MAQLHCYVPDDVAKQLQAKAQSAHMSVSKYLAHLVKQELDNQWPDGFGEVFGGWQGDPLTRPSQQGYEARSKL